MPVTGRAHRRPAYAPWVGVAGPRGSPAAHRLSGAAPAADPATRRQRGNHRPGWDRCMPRPAAPSAGGSRRSAPWCEHLFE